MIDIETNGYETVSRVLLGILKKYNFTDTKNKHPSNVQHMATNIGINAHNISTIF